VGHQSSCCAQRSASAARGFVRVGCMLLLGVIMMQRFLNSAIRHQPHKGH
jgi:hypothetical protein